MTTNLNDAAGDEHEDVSRDEDEELDVDAGVAAAAGVTVSDLSITGVLARPRIHAELPYPKWQ